MMTADDILDWARQRPDDDEDASSPAAVLIAVDNLLIEAGR